MTLSISSQELDYWPKRIGFNTEKYDEKMDTKEKIQHIINSWQKTSIQNGFLANNEVEVNCQPCSENHLACHILSFQKSNLPTEKTTLHAKITFIEADFDHNYCSKDSCISLKIIGNNNDNIPFCLYITLYQDRSCNDKSVTNLLQSF